MKLSEITPVILTLDEAANLRRTLTALTWADRVVVIDSGSVDETKQIASSFSNVTWFEQPFVSHTDQWNAGLAQVQTPWALTLDADYVASPGLSDELAELEPTVDCFLGFFEFHIFGQKLRGSLYPPRPLLFRIDRFQYIADGHTQALNVGSAPCGRLASLFIHDDRKNFGRWVQSQRKYAELEADKLSSMTREEMDWKDRIRTWMIPATFLTLVYCLFYKRLILDGRAGWYYTFQRVIAEMLLAVKLMDGALRKDDGALRKDLVTEPNRADDRLVSSDRSGSLDSPATKVVTAAPRSALPNQSAPRSAPPNQSSP